MLTKQQLLNETQFLDTVHEWVFRPKGGFLRYLGKLQQYLNVYQKNNIKEVKYSIPFYRNKDDSLILRFPGVALLGTVGINVGLYGAVSFTKLYTKYDKISLLC